MNLKEFLKEIAKVDELYAPPEISDPEEGTLWGSPFYVHDNLLKQLGGLEGLEQLIWQRNVERNERYWRFNKQVYFNTQYYGYGHYVEGGKFQFYNWTPEAKSGEPV